MKKMKPGLKKGFVATLVLGIIFLVAWIGVVAAGIFLNQASTDYLKNFTDKFTTLGTTIFENVKVFVTGGFAQPAAIASFSAVALAVLLFLILIIVAIAKRYGKIVWIFIPLFLTSTLAAYYIPGSFEAFKTLDWQNNLTGEILKISEYATAGLAYFFTLLAYFIGLGGAGSAQEPVVETPAEEVIDWEPELEPEEVEEVIEETPVEETQPTAEPEPVVEPTPAPAPAPAPQPFVVVPPVVVETKAPVQETKNEITKEYIAELIRTIVRDEIAHANQGKKEAEPSSQTHSVITGPLVVQYFGYNPTNPVTPPQVEPAPAPAPAPAPVVEQVIEEPVVEEPTPVVEEVVAPAPVVEPAPEPAPVVEEPTLKAPIIRIPFEQRILDADKELQAIYNELKNYILSYGVKSRISNSGDTFRLHRKTYVKVTVAGKSLKLYLALNPEDYKDSTIPVSDAGNKDTYSEIPLVFKVKSPLSVRRAKDLIAAAMETDGLEQGSVETVNYIKEIKASLKK